MKQIRLILLCIAILICLNGCYKNRTEVEHFENRKAYCYYYKKDDSASSGQYYIDIETKNNGYLKKHYITNYYALYAKDDFTKSILEGQCTVAGYRENDDNETVYNKTCKYDNDYHDGWYVVEYDADVKKDFDTFINELTNNEYECIEIKNQGKNVLINGYWEKTYKIVDEDEYTSTYKYKFYEDGTFEKTKTIDQIYPNPKNDWQTPYHNTTTKKGFYTFDGNIIYAILQYDWSGINMKYIKDDDTIVSYNKEYDTIGDDKYIRYDKEGE